MLLCGNGNLASPNGGLQVNNPLDRSQWRKTGHVPQTALSPSGAGYTDTPGPCPKAARSRPEEYEYSSPYSRTKCVDGLLSLCGWAVPWFNSLRAGQVRSRFVKIRPHRLAFDLEVVRVPSGLSRQISGYLSSCLT